MSEHEQEQDEAQEPVNAPEGDEEEQEAEEHAETIDGPGDALQPPSESPEAQGVTPEEWEERFKKAEQRFKTYTNAISALWQEDAVHLVPLALSPSAPVGFIDVRDAGRVPDEMAKPVLEFLGFAREQEYEPDPEATECPTCKGKGRTKLPTKVPGNDSRKCPRCNGLGYEGIVSANGRTATPLDPSHLPAGEHVGPLSTEERDPAGEPRILPDGRENPNFGKWPQFKVPVPPWGVTANLTAQDAPAGVT